MPIRHLFKVFLGRFGGAKDANLVNVEFVIECCKQLPLFCLAVVVGEDRSAWTSSIEFGGIPIEFRKTILESLGKR